MAISFHIRTKWFPYRTYFTGSQTDPPLPGRVLSENADPVLGPPARLASVDRYGSMQTHDTAGDKALVRPSQTYRRRILSRVQRERTSTRLPSLSCGFAFRPVSGHFPATGYSPSFRCFQPAERISVFSGHRRCRNITRPTVLPCMSVTLTEALPDPAVLLGGCAGTALLRSALGVPGGDR